MRHLITPLVVLAVGVAVVGYVRGWYTFSSVLAGDSKTRMTVVVDQKKWQQDRDAFVRRATPIIGQLEKKLNDLVAQSKQADPAAQPAINQEIQNLTQKHEELKNDVKNLENGTQDHWEANGSQVSQKLDNLKTGFQRVFSGTPAAN